MRDRELLSFHKDYESYEFSTFASGFLGESKGYTFGFHINHYKEVYEHLLRFELDYGYSSLHKEMIITRLRQRAIYLVWEFRSIMNLMIDFPQIIEFILV